MRHLRPALIGVDKGGVGKTTISRTLLDYLAERNTAQSHDIIPVIFYIPDRNADSLEAAAILRDSFPDCQH